jgi:phosphatidylserine synthase
LEQGTGLSFFAVVGAMLYSICGILRLVRFSVKTTQAKGNTEEEAAQKRNFTGLPIPAAAIAAVSTNLFFAFFYGRRVVQFSRDIIGDCPHLHLGDFGIFNGQPVEVSQFKDASF